MDVTTLAKVIQEAHRLLPQEAREKIATVLDKGADLLMEFEAAFYEATDNSSEQNKSSIYDDVRKDMGDPPNSFDDIVKNFEQEPAPARRESGGSENLESLLGTIYDYVVAHHEAWYDARFGNYRDDNIQYPEYMLSALEELIARRDRGRA